MPEKSSQNALEQKILFLEKENARLNKINRDLNISNSRFQSFLESVDDSILICDRKARPVDWNPAYEKAMKDIRGIDIIPGMDLAGRLTFGKDIVLRKNLLEKILSGEQFKTFCTIDSDINNIRYHEITYSPIIENSLVTGFSILARDITKQKLAEEELINFKQAVDASADAIGISNAQGRHYYQNASFDDLFGDIGNDPPGTLYVDEKIGREVFDTIMSGAPWIGEVTMHGKNGKILIIFLRAYPVKDIEGKVRRLVGVHTDITKQKSIEEELTNFKQAVDASTDAIGMSNAQGDHYYQNASFDNLFGEIGNDPPSTLYADESIGREVFESIMDGKPWIGEVEMHGKEGDILNVLLRAYPTMDSEGNVRRLVGVHTDITEQKQTESELRKHREHLQELVNEKTRKLQESEKSLRRSREKSRDLTRHLQRAVEDERLRIAREIHDDLGQTLIAMKMNLVSCRKKLPDHLDPLFETALNMEKSIDQMIQSINNLISDLRAGPLSDLGLEAAIEWLANNFFKNLGYETNIELNTESVDIDPNRSMAIFRIAQEALTNIVRHSDASAVTVDLFIKNSQAILRISDNGSGIADTSALPDSSYGIMGMKERARFFKGDLHVESNEKGGTTITASIPIDD